MNILLLGSGGRESALAWKIAASTVLNKLFIAPGNAGTEKYGTNVDMKPTDFKAIKKFVLENKITYVVVGPEDPLVLGIHDYFLADKDLKSIAVIGPNKAGAQLEGSKQFSKAFMQRHAIPTAKYKSFTIDEFDAACEYLKILKAPYVIKADGLASGKGVVIAEKIEDAKSALESMLKDKQFGAASERVVIEEFLKGQEVSMFIITDGRSYKMLPEAKDYKRIGEGDTGLNTGGMGAISPVPFADEEFKDKVDNRIIIPTIKGLQAENIEYKGFIFFGLMSVKGEPYLIEYNCRMGDPETEVVMPRLKSDLLDLFEGVASGTLSERDIEIDERSAATVMLVAGGYPGDYDKGKKITGMDLINDSHLFHAGTAMKNGELVTNGGRVMAITSVAKDLDTAVSRSIYNADILKFDKKNYRKDIGQDMLKLLVKSN